MPTQFNDKSFEEILAAMLARIPDTILKIEGSIAYDALSPAALLLAELYENLNYTINQSTVETASAPYLDQLTQQMGIWRKIATYATRIGSFYDNSGDLMAVSIGDRFSIDDINYVVEDEYQSGTYILMAEEPGNAGNIPIGEMQSLQVVEGLDKAVLGEVIIAGEDEETDYNLSQRYLRTMMLDAQNANVAQYQEWLEEYTGIGRYKVIPCWDGENTVKIIILDSHNESASPALIDEVQDYFDPNSDGLGNGIAPIGAKVTVTTATDQTVNISATITLISGYNIATVKALIEDALENYFSAVAFEKDAVYYIDVASVVLNTEGVATVSSLTINGGTANIPLTGEQIAKLGTVTITG